MKAKKICPNCGDPFSGRSKYCTYKCALPAMIDAIEQLKKKEGPIYEKWKARSKASLGRL